MAESAHHHAKRNRQRTRPPLWMWLAGLLLITFFAAIFFTRPASRKTPATKRHTVHTGTTNRRRHRHAAESTATPRAASSHRRAETISDRRDAADYEDDNVEAPRRGSGGNNNDAQQQPSPPVTTASTLVTVGAPIHARVGDVAMLSNRTADDERLRKIFSLKSARQGGAYDASRLPRYAYVLVVSNEIFVDGALVMGTSLRLYSTYLQTHTAHLVLIATEGRLSASSIQRLEHAGGFDAVLEVPSLAKRAPKAFHKDTFDKSYMFALVQYEKVVFVDADMIAVKSMDPLFEKDFGDETYLGAIGFRGTGGEADYFQTGMMVIRPSWKMYDKIAEEFDANVPPRGHSYNEGMHGRDGSLLRAVFGNRFREIDNKYSRNLNPRYAISGSLVAVHLRGTHKPWFNRFQPNENPALGKKEFGFPYLEWWRIYDEWIHRKSPEYVRCRDLVEKLPMAQRKSKSTIPVPDVCRHVAVGEDGTAGYYGGAHAAPDVSPLTHVWMLRHSPKEYVQLTAVEDARRRWRDMPSATGDEQILVGALGDSCDATCAKHHPAMACDPAGFNNSALQNCEFLTTLDSACATACELAVYWRPHPGNDYPAVLQLPSKKDHAQLVPKGTFDAAGPAGPPVCRYNLMFDERSQPSCAAANATTRRFCPCRRSTAD